MTPREILVNARAMIADPANFTLAARSLVDGVHNFTGAIWAQLGGRGGDEREPFFAADAAVMLAMHRRGYASMNDLEQRGSHADALEIYDQAIASSHHRALG